MDCIETEPNTEHKVLTSMTELDNAAEWRKKIAICDKCPHFVALHPKMPSQDG